MGRSITQTRCRPRTASLSKSKSFTLDCCVHTSGLRVGGTYVVTLLSFISVALWYASKLLGSSLRLPTAPAGQPQEQAAMMEIVIEGQHTSSEVTPRRTLHWAFLGHAADRACGSGRPTIADVRLNFHMHGKMHMDFSLHNVTALELQPPSGSGHTNWKQRALRITAHIG